jgi:hypothetical protein
VVDIHIPGMPFSRKAKETKGGHAAQGEKAGGEKKAPAHGHAHAASSELQALRRKVAVYRRIIERYREIIEKAETKTITELRLMIRPNDPAVLQMRDEVLSDFRPYMFEEHFEKAVKMAYEYVREKIANEELPVDFWLTPEDVLDLRAADEMDKAVLLCSLLRSLECEDAKVVVESDGDRHVYVGYSFKGRYTLMDPTHGEVAHGGREEVLEKQFGGRGKVVYEFNDKEYDEILGGE